MIKKIIRINATNQCNISCITCPISANQNKVGFIKFSDYQNILCSHKNIPLDIILEGGEPFLHPRLFLFLEYADTIPNAKKVIISTNGTLLQEYYNTLLDTINRLRIRIHLNVAITSHLLKCHNGHMEMCKSLLNENKIITTFDVTYTSEDEKQELIDIIKSYEIPMELCSFDIVRAYGALKDTEYPKLQEGNMEWCCYASDGTYFGYDLAKRAEYELTICQTEVPTFDIINHRNMWMLTRGFLADLTFENQDNIEESVKSFQEEYIRLNTPNMKSKTYILDYMNITGENPVTVKYSNLYEDEIVYGLAPLMAITPNMERFYHYKDHAMKLCFEIANFKADKNVKTTDEDYCICKK